MIDYQAEKHETLLVAWFFQLQSMPDEFEKLFMAPLRNLTSLLQWAKSQVKFLFSADEKGIWAAGWFEPIGTSAFFGTWLRPDARKGPQAYAFVRRCQRLGLEHNSELIGLTCQPELERVHLALGYRKLDITLHLFDNQPTWVYILDREGLKRKRSKEVEKLTENIDERRNGRFDAILPELDDPFDAWKNDEDQYRRLASDRGQAVVLPSDEDRPRIRSKTRPKKAARLSGAHAQNDSTNGIDGRPQRRRRIKQSTRKSPSMHAVAEHGESTIMERPEI